MPTEDWVLPIINLELCTGCGDCVIACLGKAVVLRQGYATIVQPEACTYCGDCEEFCPEGAIARPFEIVFRAPREIPAEVRDQGISDQAIRKSGCLPKVPRPPRPDSLVP